jgi:GNAT superfamily N-acetyltransferase
MVQGPVSRVQVRDATVDDAAALVPLLDALGYPADPATIRARLPALGAVGTADRVLVAEADGALLGFAALHATPTLHRGAPVGRITGLAVLPDRHGVGVGRRLVEAAEAHFRACGAERMEVTSGPSHQPAHAFYRHLGYDDQGVRFAKSLLDPAPKS